MKQLSLFIVGLLTTLSVLAQYNNGQNNNRSIVTITVNGTKPQQITVDGKDYNLIINAAVSNKTKIEIGDLENGQHTFQVTRTEQNARRSNIISTIFNLRRRYDMQINVNANGSLELIEKMKFQNDANNKRVMSTANFTTLLNNVKYQKTTSGKRTVITNAFNTPNNNFSSSQVVLLMQQVSGESYRLELAKLSYHTVVDPNNFNQVANLLNSQSSRDALDVFVNNYNDNNNNDEGNNLTGAMSDESFNSLFQTIQQQWPVSTQMSSLTTAFNNTNNLFSAYQASQLIQIVSAESNRLQLAKLSYRSIVDKENLYPVYELLKIQSSRNELESYINNYQGSGNTGTAMSDASFNSLFQTIQQQWPASTQISSLTNAFNNTNYYFSTYQASRLIQIVSGENNRLQLAKLSYRSITDQSNFTQLYTLLSTQAAKNELAAYVASYAGGGTGNQDAMTDADFNNLFQTIQQQWPATTQLNSLTAAFSNTNYFFSTYQASRLIQIISGENNRLQLAKLSYRGIIDQSNFTQLYTLLSTQAAKNELTAYVASYTGGGTVSNVAMSDADFNTVKQSVQMQFLPGGKMATLTNIFNTSTYYFTSSQARQLIELVSSESNRLQLAKSSYRNITDRANFTILYDLLNSQSSKDELQAYVNTYVD